MSEKHDNISYSAIKFIEKKGIKIDNKGMVNNISLSLLDEYVQSSICKILRLSDDSLIEENKMFFSEKLNINLAAKNKLKESVSVFICEVVSDVTMISYDNIVNIKGRRSDIAIARHIARYLCHKYAHLTSNSQFFKAAPNHASAINSIRVIEDAISVNYNSITSLLNTCEVIIKKQLDI